MAHRCHAAMCNKQVDPKMFMCREHWFKLPLTLRKLIWKTYRLGQEDDKNPSKEYCLAAMRCIAHLAGRDGLSVEQMQDGLAVYKLYLREERKETPNAPT